MVMIKDQDVSILWRKNKGTSWLQWLSMVVHLLTFERTFLKLVDM